MAKMEPDSTGRVSRRRIIKAIGAGTAVAWSAPILTSIRTPAFAQYPPPPPDGTGSINGRVTDAQTGDPIFGAVVMADTGQTDTTDVDGFYELLNVPAGSRTVTASAAGYVSASSTVVVPDGGSVTLNFSLAPLGSITAVLTWNAVVRDLDLHMSGPDGDSGRFHVFFGDPTHDDYVSLDRDDTNGEGPETIRVTISATHGGQFVAGEYHVWVHSFTGEDFNLSDAVVRLNDQTSQRGEFDAASATGDSAQDIWLVVHFDLDESGTMSNIQAQQSFTTGGAGDVF